MGKRLIIKGASFAINAIEKITPTTTYYTVIYNLSHCTASNNATSIAEGSTYIVTISPQNGYSISNVVVRHNGVAVNPTSGYTYRINSVSGNITVSASATQVITNYTVTYDLENATASNTATVVESGSSYSVTLTPNSGYVISSASVTHNRVEVEPTSDYTYNIPSVSGNILVECVATAQIVNYSVTYNLTNVMSSTSVTTVQAGSSYIVTLTPRADYVMSSATVTHNGMTIMPTGSGYTYKINSVAGNIVINATAVAQVVTTYNVTYNLTNCTSNNSTTTVNEGSNYSFTLTPNSGYRMDSVTVTHNGTAVTPTSNYTYNISNVRGNIIVTASAIEDVVVENANLTILGKYDVNVTATQGDNTITTSGSYTSANGGELQVLTNTDIDVSAVATVQGETIQGLQLNGNTVTSPIRITGDSVLAPKAKGNLAYVKYSGGTWSSNKTVASDSVHYRTEIIPVVKDEPLTIKIPNHANETVKIRTWYCSCYGTYSTDNSGLLSIALDANGVGTINPKITGHFALHPSYASDYTATVFSTDDIKGIELNYTTSTAWQVPAFKWEQVLDLGAVSTASSTNTWNQSAMLYNNYMITMSATLYQFKVINLTTEKVVKTITNSNKQTDIHANSACFLPKKYDESDYYPMFITNVHGAASDKLVVFRLAGTTATSFTVQRICDWTYTNSSYLDMQVNGNVLYILGRASDTYPDLRGLWRIPMNFNDSSIYVDNTFDLSTMQDAVRILPSFYQRIGQDCTLITQAGKDDIYVNTYGPTTDMPTQHAGMVFYRAGATEGHLIGWLPTNRILNGYEHDGVVYAGNGILYCVLVNSSHAYLYKFRITIPEI